jgi:hypothetical protein
MPSRNAIVSTTVRLDPPLDRSAEEMLKGDRVVYALLEGERRIRLDPADPRSPGFVRVLDGLSKERLPVYLELDPATESIARLAIPHVVRVEAIEAGEGALDVRLEPSHARHRLPLGGPESEALESRLREALRHGQPILVTEDDAHDIIDVRAFTPSPEGPPQPPFPLPSPKPPLLSLLAWVWRILWWLWWWIRFPWWWWFRCLSMTRAQQVFDAMAATSCDPLTVPPPCIPFLYPDDGCWARAHEMSRLMLGMGLSPRKVWIDASTTLHVNTRNNPNCSVYWGWHVAPTLCVRGPRFFQTQRVVIDPSLFTAPVSEATWKSVQGDPNATLTDTDWTRFWHGGGTDPGYTSTNYYLAVYRLELLNRSNQFGPPPYANCP